MPATITIQPVLPVWLLVGLWLAAVLWGWFGLRGCGVRLRPALGLLALRAAALAILVWLLLEPQRRREKVEQELPVLAVAVDVSASMADQVADLRETRADRVGAFLRDGRVRDALAKYRVWWFELGENAEESPSRGTELLFNAAQSNLGPSLNRIAGRLQAQNAAGILLLSDGLDQSGAALTAEARALPVFALELEDPVAATREKPDYWIEDLTYPQRAVVNWQVGLEVMVRRRGQGAAQMPVRLLQNGKEAQTATVAWEAGESFRQVAFSVSPTEVGQLLLRVELQPPADDTVATNNSREALIDVVDPENRVLYLEGMPRWEFKFLKRALMAEKNVMLSSFVSTGRGGFVTFSEDAKVEKETMPPLTREGLARFKVVILGNLPGDALKPENYEALRDFVDRGGGLLLLGGARAYAADGWGAQAAFRDCLPALPADDAKFHDGTFTIDVTPAGRAHPVLQGLGLTMDFPHLLSVCEPVQTSQFSTVLLTTLEGAPLLIVRPFGQGRVAMLLSDSFWRWQMGSADATASRNVYQMFFAQIALWLGPQVKELDAREMLQLFLAHNEVDARRKVVVGARLESQGKAQAGSLLCRIEPPAGPAVSLPMVPATLDENVGLARPLDGYACEFRPQTPGSYTLVVTSADGQFSARARLLAREPVRERSGAAIDRTWLQDVARASGGAFVPWRERHGVFTRLSQQARELRTVLEYPLWPKVYWILALIGLFCAEWVWRRKLDFV